MRWARTTVGDYGSVDVDVPEEWRPGTPVTIMPTADADEALRLLQAMDEHFDSGRRCVFCEGKGGMHQTADADMGRKDCPAVQLRAFLARTALSPTPPPMPAREVRRRHGFPDQTSEQRAANLASHFGPSPAPAVEVEPMVGVKP